MTDLGPPEAEMAATGLPAWIMWVWNKSREKVWAPSDFWPSVQSSREEGS